MDRDSAPQKPSRQALEQQLVQDLHAMRDSLTRLSLMLHDLNYLVEAPQRLAAQELADACIARSQSRQC